MDYKERMGQLMERVGKEYRHVLESADFNSGDIVEEARKVATADMVYRNLDFFLDGYPGDVEAMLFHDRPLGAFYDSLPEKGLLLLCWMSEALNQFLEETRAHIHEVCGHWETAPLHEIERAREYMDAERKIAALGQKEEQEREVREQLRVQYHDNIRQDYAGCQEYLKRYGEPGGGPAAAMEEAVSLIYGRMLAFDGLTLEELQAMAGMAGPLTAVYRCFFENVKGSLHEQGHIDRAILMAARGWENAVGYESREEEDGLER